MACQPVMTGESHWNMGGINGGWLVGGGAQQWPKTQTFNNCMRGISPYVTIAASLAEATTHWDAVSELWVASGCTSLHSGSSHCVKYFRKCRPVDSTLCTACIYITAKAIGLYILQALSFLGGTYEGEAHRACTWDRKHLNGPDVFMTIIIIYKAK